MVGADGTLYLGDDKGTFWIIGMMVKKDSYNFGSAIVKYLQWIKLETFILVLKYTFMFYIQK